MKSFWKPTEYIKTISTAPTYLAVDSNHNYLNVLLNCDEFKYKPNTYNKNINDCLVIWENSKNANNTAITKFAKEYNKQILIAGDSFLRSIYPYSYNKYCKNKKYVKGISITFDDTAQFYNSTKISRLEQMLNDTELILTNEQIARARYCIDYIVNNHLTKYNAQPIITPNYGRPGKKKILVVDQKYSDMSITLGMANKKTFSDMLNHAKATNPDADILIKSHPDFIYGKLQSYYNKNNINYSNVYFITEPINPISLIQYCDKVYVCSTQFGFESLMCGKETHVFGMPFYAGWGLTHDNIKLDRRTNKRTLEEIFYIAYIEYSYYVNPNTGKQCEIEEAMEYLVNLRNEYFNLEKQND